MSDQEVDTVTQFLKIKDEKSGEERQIAYKRTHGEGKPGIIFMAGFMSTKDAIKPTALHKFCKKHGFPFVRYDATALGESQSSIELKDAGFSHWLQDAEEVLLQLTEGPQLVIGSSMGGWIASCLAKKYPEKFMSLLLLAPSINFSNFYIERISSKAPAPLLESLENGGFFEYNDPKYGVYPLSLKVFRDMIPYELPFEETGGYPVTCPVRLIHGTEDTYSPYETSLKVLKCFETSDIQLTYLKGAGHHLDDEQSLNIIYEAILKMTDSSSKL